MAAVRARTLAEALELLESALPEYLAAGDDEAAGAVHSRIGSALCLHHSVMDIPRALEHFDAAERLLAAPRPTTTSTAVAPTRR